MTENMEPRVELNFDRDENLEIPFIKRKSSYETIQNDVSRHESNYNDCSQNN